MKTPNRLLPRRVAFVAILSLLLSPSARALDNWVRVGGAPFDTTSNIACDASRTMSGFLYVGIHRKTGTGGGQVWRSATGESGSWSQTTISPALTGQNPTIFDFYDTGGFMWFTTGSGTGAGLAKVYRSSNGTTWSLISGAGSGFDTTGNNAALRFASRGDTLFVSAQNKATGAQLWAIKYTDTTGWYKVLDARDTDIGDSGFENICQLISFGDSIYVGFQDTSPFPPFQPTQVFMSRTGDSNTWVKNNGVGNGFGNPNNIAIAGADAFQGLLYFTTNNREDLSTGDGGQLWRSPDGLSWTQVTADAFGHPKAAELHHITVAGNRMWITTRAAYARGESAAIYRSFDGLTWVASNDPGFGDSNNEVGLPTVAVLGDTVIWTGENDTEGAQCWRLGGSAVTCTVVLEARTNHSGCTATLWDGTGTDTFWATSDTNGTILFYPVPPGTYTFRGSTPRHLVRQVGGISVSNGDAATTIGTLRAGDLNGDNIVNILDASRLHYFLRRGLTDAAVDIDGDGDVDANDLLWIRIRWHMRGD